MGIQQRSTTGDLVGTMRSVSYADTAIAANAGATIDISFADAAANSVVSCSFRAAISSNAAVQMAAPPRVTTAGTVRLTFWNHSTDAATIDAATIDCQSEKY